MTTKEIVLIIIGIPFLVIIWLGIDLLLMIRKHLKKILKDMED